MNLPFLKLRIAKTSWILFDREKCLECAEGLEPDWSVVSRTICDAYTGASAAGSIVFDTTKDPVDIEVWGKDGKKLPPPPSAVICATRWYLDRGLSDLENITFVSNEKIFEPIVINSTTIGLAVGRPFSSDGKEIDSSTVGTKLLTTGSGLIFPIKFDDEEECKVYLFDSIKSAKEHKVQDKSKVIAVPISRFEIYIKTGKLDPVFSAAASLVVSSFTDYSDREATVLINKTRFVVQWPENESVFVAAAPEYCVSGEVWIS